MKEAKKVQINQQICEQARLMRKGGANQMKVAALLGINGSTVSRIESAGFDYQKYLENRRIAKEREKKAKERAEEQEPQQAEEQVPGQMEMDLTPKAPEMTDQVKLMRFQAGQVDKLYMKLETINDTLSQILRAMKKD